MTHICRSVIISCLTFVSACVTAAHTWLAEVRQECYLNTSCNRTSVHPEWQRVSRILLFFSYVVFMQCSGESKDKKSWCFSIWRGIQNSKWCENELECSSFQNVTLLLHKNTYLANVVIALYSRSGPFPRHNRTATQWRNAPWQLVG